MSLLFEESGPKKTKKKSGLSSLTKSGLSTKTKKSGTSMSIFGEDDLFGASFVACWADGRLPIQLQVPGHHMILNALSAVAVGLTLNVPLEKIQQGLAAFSPRSGRMAVEKLSRFTLLNHVYNANPTSMKASLQVLSKAPGRKVCILGDMLELGEQAAILHERVAQEASMLNIDVIIGVGPLFYEAMKKTLESISVAKLGNSLVVPEGMLSIAVGSPMGMNFSILTGNVTSITNTISTVDAN